jgi:hypothetical protein
LSIAVENPVAAGHWDVAVIDQSGGLALMPAGAFSGLESRAGIATITAQTTLEELKEAPRDTAAFSDAAVAALAGRIYVIRSRRENCGFGTFGVRYTKLEVLQVNTTAGTLSFRKITNPYCNDRKLIPPD